VTRSIQHPRTGNFVYSQLAGRRHVTSAIFFARFCRRAIFVARQNPRMQLCVLQMQLECGPMSNVMAALPNIGGALFSMPQSLADAQ